MRFSLEQHSEDDMLIECSLKTIDCEELLGKFLQNLLSVPLFFCLKLSFVSDFTSTESSVLNLVIFKGDILTTLFSDADNNSDYVEIYLSPETPHMKITFKGKTVSHIN